MKRRPPRLGGVRPHPLYLAEFSVARDVGDVPLGTQFKRNGVVVCDSGAGMRTERKNGRTVIPFSVAREGFIAARVEQVGGKNAGGAMLPSWGVWQGGREPSFVAQISWTPNDREPNPRAFQNNMVGLCERLACRFSQKEVMLRLSRQGKRSLLLRCSPTGARRPPDL
jgi:hypothetical protein